MKKLVAILLLLLLIISLPACGNTDSSSAAQIEEEIIEEKSSPAKQQEETSQEQDTISAKPEEPMGPANEASDEETSEMPASEKGKTASVPAGQYIGGRDIPVGQYVLTRSEGKSGSGIVSLSSPEDNLDEEYPSLIYEFVSKEEEMSFFISLQEGGVLKLPFECILTTIDYSHIEIGTSIPADAGAYTGGLDLPAGQYLLSYGEDHSGGGIIWLSSASDDLSSEYPSKIYEYIGEGRDGKWFISLDDGGRLYLPFPCDTITRITPYDATEGQFELFAGWYSVGTDIPAGKYNITCKTNQNNSGIVWVSSPNDYLDEEYPSVLYEFIGRDEEESFYFSVEEGAVIYLPCDAVFSFGGIIFS